MDAKTLSESWQKRSQEISSQVAQWRVDHPTATLAEIEQAVDEQMTSLRAQMIQEAAQASSASEGRTPAEEPRTCPECGGRMQARGRHQRHLQTQGGREVILNRRYLNCPQCGYSFFPPR
jgi:DNA-directed RNA polymerase subunit RPC12/RpoP